MGHRQWPKNWPIWPMTHRPIVYSARSSARSRAGHYTLVCMCLRSYPQVSVRQSVCHKVARVSGWPAGRVGSGPMILTRVQLWCVTRKMLPETKRDRPIPTATTKGKQKTGLPGSESAIICDGRFTFQTSPRWQFRSTGDGGPVLLVLFSMSLC